MVIVQWVLWLAPLGVFSLALVTGELRPPPRDVRWRITSRSWSRPAPTSPCRSIGWRRSPPR
ncbi:hypothetical protein AB5I41_09635 [Sphingomonas sp. MMS24-JH45]